MAAFGTSAFLKLVHMNPRPQRTELRRRLMPREGGYDFHNSLRRLAQQLLVEGLSLGELSAAAEGISRASERRSALVGLQRLCSWRDENSGIVANIEPAIFRSPSGLFSVTYKPNFLFQTAHQRTAVHIWNTAAPRLEPHLVRAVLSLFANAYSGTGIVPDDLAILCLRTMRLIRLGNSMEVAELGRLVVAHIDTLLGDISSELGERPASRDQPPAPRPTE